MYILQYLFNSNSLLHSASCGLRAKTMTPQWWLSALRTVLLQPQGAIQGTSQGAPSAVRFYCDLRKWSRRRKQMRKGKRSEDIWLRYAKQSKPGHTHASGRGGRCSLWHKWKYRSSDKGRGASRGEMLDRGSNTHESIMINIKSPRLRGRPNLLTTSALIAEIKFISFIMRCAMQNVK